jgi:hypothetical protein
MRPIFRRVASGFGAAAALVGFSAQAQESYKIDALRFSQIQANGTSRTQGMGGASSALGADLGAFVLNPANLGGYRRSEFSISPGLLMNSTTNDANLSNRTEHTMTDDSRNGFNIANLGVVIATRKDDNEPGDWRSGSVGINFSRLATFSNRRTYGLTLPDSSYSAQEYVVQDFLGPGGGNINDVLTAANNNEISNFTDLGYNGYLLNFQYDAMGNPTGNFRTPNWRGSQAKQTETTEMRGAVNQIDIGYGASYRDKLYVGGSLGIVTARYRQTRTLTETLDKNTSELASLALIDGYTVNGGGINLRIGMVYRPADMLRLGVAIQTPTFMGELKEQADQTTLRTNFRQPFSGYAANGANPVTNVEASIPASAFQYALTTPFRATGGLALILKSGSGGAAVSTATGNAAENPSSSTVGGIISADIDYVNYGSARLSNVNNDASSFGEANAAIKREYTSAVNYRVGAELRLGIFRVRGGYGLYGSPYADSKRGGERTVISGGVGIRKERGYVDFGFSQTKYDADEYRPYTLSTANPDTSPTADPYLPYTATTAREPVVKSSYKLLNPTVTIGFIIQ